MDVSLLACKPVTSEMLVNVPDLVTSYYTEIPYPTNQEQRVSFGTSGHRGSAFDKSFNEWHILAINHSICLYRKQRKINGPLFLGMDTHALSIPALASALEVLAANGVEVIVAEGDEYTPTPAISLAILTYNRGRKSGWFAARPSGTEEIYKIYAESFRGADHLKRIQEEAQTIVSAALVAGMPQ
jgi:phosphoglucomutase